MLAVQDYETFLSILQDPKAKTDLNLVDQETVKSVFETVLTNDGDMSKFISACIEHGADMYKVG